MSIGEILVAVLIMLLATGVVTATVGLGAQKYLRTLAGSEANVLASTLESLMTSELAYTTEVYVDHDGNVKMFQSQNYTTATSLSMFQVEDGKVMVTYPEDSDKDAIKLLGDGSYPNNLQVSMDSITYCYEEGKGIFTIHFTIARYGETVLQRSFQVISINQTEPREA